MKEIILTLASGRPISLNCLYIQYYTQAMDGGNTTIGINNSEQVVTQTPAQIRALIVAPVNDATLVV